MDRILKAKDILGALGWIRIKGDDSIAYLITAVTEKKVFVSGISNQILDITYYELSTGWETLDPNGEWVRINTL